MFEPLYNIINKARSLNQDFAVQAFDNKKNTDLAIELNLQEQMYERGVNAEGKPMGDYAPVSKLMKQQKGERYDHITGFDTGEMYKSETAQFDSNGNLLMRMDTIKEGEDITETRWGKDIVGLTDESKEILRVEIKNDTIKATRTFLTNRGN